MSASLAFARSGSRICHQREVVPVRFVISEVSFCEIRSRRVQYYRNGGCHAVRTGGVRRRRKPTVAPCALS